MMGSRCFYAANSMELASHGYIVFTLDHHDFSNPYTEDASGNKQWKFDTSVPWFEYEDVHKKINIREKEAISLIDEITKRNFL